jgi:creatinine amidohydrolase/Fe(II)-dependent formamide hydrolase-like protein
MIELEKLTSRKFEKLERSLIIIIPVGAAEAHDEFLPLNTDNLIVQAIAKEAAKRTDNIYGIPITEGSSISSLAGRIYIDYGFKKIFILNGHGKNKYALEPAVENIKKKFKGIKIETSGWWNFCARKIPHTGKAETEMALAVDPSIGNPSDSPNNPDIKEGKKLYREVVDNIVKMLKEKW